MFLSFHGDLQQDDLRHLCIMFISIVMLQEIQDEDNQEREHKRRKLHASYERRRIPRASIPDVQQSFIHFIIHHPSDMTFRDFFGVTPGLFHDLLQPFSALFWRTTYLDAPEKEFFRPLDKSPRRRVQAEQALAFALHYLRSTSQREHICGLFNVLQPQFNKYLYFCLALLRKVLKRIPTAKVRIPTAEEQICFSHLIQSKYPLLPFCVGAMDGLKLDLSTTYEDRLEDNNYYNGWLKKHCIGNMFVWGPDGKIWLGAVNFPGSFHDSQICIESGIYEKLLSKLHPRMWIAADSAFAVKGRYSRILKRPSKIDEPGPQTDVEQALENSIIGVRQLSEWGNNALKGAFPRLKMKMPLGDSRKRLLILDTCCHLHNLRTEMGMPNEITTTFLLPHVG